MSLQVAKVDWRGSISCKQELFIIMSLDLSATTYYKNNQN